MNSRLDEIYRKVHRDLDEYLEKTVSRIRYHLPSEDGDLTYPNFYNAIIDYTISIRAEWYLTSEAENLYNLVCKQNDEEAEKRLKMIENTNVNTIKQIMENPLLRRKVANAEVDTVRKYMSRRFPTVLRENHKTGKPCPVTVDNKTYKTIKQACKELELDYGKVLRYRDRYGIPADEAIKRYMNEHKKNV